MLTIIFYKLHGPRFPEEFEFEALWALITTIPNLKMPVSTWHKVNPKNRKKCVQSCESTKYNLIIGVI